MVRGRPYCYPSGSSRPGSASEGWRAVSGDRGRLDLRVGEWVEVRPLDEILGTLDANGCFEELPFMPEMVPYCGRRFRVRRRADKTCDRVHKSGLRRMHGTVHLGDLRCDGAAHGGCQALCLLFFKEAWLVRSGPADTATPAPPPPVPASLLHAVRAPGSPDAGPEVRWSCQATRAFDATEAFSRLDFVHYLRDVRTGNATVGAVVRWWITKTLNRLQRIRGTWRLIDTFRGPFRVPTIKGSLTKTPVERLDLKPGELVRVKPLEAIRATLDAKSRNRGLSFDVEMVRYCGQEMRVLSRVDRIIDEPTGKMMTFANDCIILDQAICAADFHGFCPRAIYPYWREIWLERVRPHGG